MQHRGWRGACCNPGPGEVAGPNRGLYGAATAAERWPFGGCERLLPKAARAYRWRERSWRSPRRSNSLLGHNDRSNYRADPGSAVLLLMLEPERAIARCRLPGEPSCDPSDLRYGDPNWSVEGDEIVRAAAALHAEDDDFIQAGNLYREVMTPTDRDHLVKNLVAHLGDGVESGSSGNGQSHSGGVWTRASGRVSPRDSGWSFPTASADPAERCGAIRGARRGRTPWPRTRRALQLPV